MMARTSSMLAESGGTGAPTQRLQTDILTMLDRLIKDAQENSNSSSSSSSSSSSQSQSQAQPNKPQAGKDPSQKGGGDGEPQEGPPPPGSAPQLRSPSPTELASWGNLPTKVRDALQQGASDQFSSLYERLTEAYYQRLAEEGSD